jgi:hypothetical protein
VSRVSCLDWHQRSRCLAQVSPTDTAFVRQQHTSVAPFALPLSTDTRVVPTRCLCQPAAHTIIQRIRKTLISLITLLTLIILTIIRSSLVYGRGLCAHCCTISIDAVYVLLCDIFCVGCVCTVVRYLDSLCAH